MAKRVFGLKITIIKFFCALVPGVDFYRHLRRAGKFSREGVSMIEVKKKDRESLGKQLESLKKERKEIESKIIPLVPSSYHDIQIIVFSSRRITISGENVIMVFN